MGGLYNLISFTELRNLAQWANLDFSFRGILLSIFWGKAIGNEYLWFLQSLAFVYVICIVAQKCSFWGILSNIWALLILFYWFCAEGMIAVFGKTVPIYYYRNPYLEGMGFFLMGNWIKNHQNKIIFSKTKCFILLICGVGLTSVEYYLLGKCEFYVGSLMIMLSLFMLSITANLSLDSLIFHIGGKYSLYLYLGHPMIILILQILVIKVNINGSIESLLINPISVFILTILLTIIIKSFFKRIPLLLKAN